MGTLSTVPSETGISPEKAATLVAAAGLSAFMLAAGSPIVRRSVISLHYALLLGGVGALTFLAAMFFKPEIADRFKAASPFSNSTVLAENIPLEESEPLAAALIKTPPEPVPVPQPKQATVTAPKQATATAPKQADPVVNPAASVVAAVADPSAAAGNFQKQVPSDRRQQLVSQWLSKRYRVASDATQMLVSSAFQTANELKLDPLLILAVMAIESRFNPFAESPVGAQGLMQVMSKVHHDKFQPLGGVKVALNPAANIRVGSLILRDYVKRGGSVEAGLKLYVGAAAFDTDFGYGNKVLAEYRRLKDVANGKKVPVITASAPKTPTPKPRTEAVAEVKASQPPAEAKAQQTSGFGNEGQQSKTEEANVEVAPI